MAVVQRELVDRKQWLTPEEFVEDWAVAQLLPGPNVINLSLMLGDRHFGTAGAVSALAGLLCFPLIIVLALAVVFSGVAESTAVQGALRGMGAVVAGLIAANACKLLPALRTNPVGLGWCIVLSVAAFCGVALLHLQMVWVVLGLGLPGCWWAAHRIKHPPRKKSAVKTDSST